MALPHCETEAVELHDWHKCTRVPSLVQVGCEGDDLAKHSGYYSHSVSWL